LSEYVLEMVNISKSFPGVRALNKIDFRVKKGTIHALVGENGAGKSTLMKILIGMYRPDEGEIIFDGKKFLHLDVAEALRLGISMVHQELTPIPYMTVAENIGLGREPGGKVFVNDKELNEKAKEALKHLGEEIDPKKKMRDLSTAQIQIVEIAKAVSRNVSLIIMDEPTTALTKKEVENLFRLIRKLREQGISFVYISHRLEEIFEIADEVTVLRDGQLMGTGKIGDFDKETLIKMMVGREITQFFPKIQVDIGDVILEVKNLSLKGKFHDISFEVRRGEILGIAGLVGSGRSELMQSIFGVIPPDRGEIYKNKQRINIRSPEDAIRHGIAFLTEDRKRSGLFLPLSVLDNMVMPNLEKFEKWFFVSDRLAYAACEKLRKELDIKTPTLYQIVRNLSGGNQQKVVLARWLMRDAEILILDEPTKGIDVGAKAEIHHLMSRLAEQGRAIIMISSEMPEILGMSDRILVMHDGRITGVLDRKEADQEKVMALALS